MKFCASLSAKTGSCVLFDASNPLSLQPVAERSATALRRKETAVAKLGQIGGFPGAGMVGLQRCL